MAETYLAPRYCEAPEQVFGEIRDINAQYRGTTDPLAVDPHWASGLSFMAGSMGAMPKAGDIALINSFGRLDGFTADGRFFILAES